MACPVTLDPEEPRPVPTRLVFTSPNRRHFCRPTNWTFILAVLLALAIFLGLVYILLGYTLNPWNATLWPGVEGFFVAAFVLVGGAAVFFCLGEFLFRGSEM